MILGAFNKTGSQGWNDVVTWKETQLAMRSFTLAHNFLAPPLWKNNQIIFYMHQKQILQIGFPESSQLEMTSIGDQDSVAAVPSCPTFLSLLVIFWIWHNLAEWMVYTLSMVCTWLVGWLSSEVKKPSCGLQLHAASFQSGILIELHRVPAMAVC